MQTSKFRRVVTTDNYLQMQNFLAYSFFENDSVHKWHIDEKKCRTGRINEALRLICSTDKGFRHKKTGQLFKNLELSGNVEVTGIEPVSKHGIRKLSTCLFQHCLSGKNRS